MFAIRLCCVRGSLESRESHLDVRGTNHRHPCPVVNCQRCSTKQTSMTLGNKQALGEVGKLTNREKASLNSETCSSVRESAWRWVSAVRDSRGPARGRVFQGGVWRRVDSDSAGLTHHDAVWVWGVERRGSWVLVLKVQAVGGYSGVRCRVEEACVDVSAAGGVGGGAGPQVSDCPN
jgi:hypothetical protein